MAANLPASLTTPEVPSCCTALAASPTFSATWALAAAALLPTARIATPASSATQPLAAP
ncbi:MAG: hypothetical protein AAHH96_00040 [Candidatus Symbiodolus clandestinus]